MARRLQPGPNLRLGVVVGFEPERGLGTVAEDLAGQAQGSYPFHSTAIADRSRQIEPGTAVAFVVVPAHRGRLEARDLRPLSLVTGGSPP